MFISSIRDIIAKLSALASLARSANNCDCLQKIIQMRSLVFVDVIYDDWHGIKRPIGLVHELKMPDGRRREVFTFCCASRRQPAMALFVKKRTGNMADDIALTFEEQEIIPRFLKELPDAYREAHFQSSEPATYSMAV